MHFTASEPFHLTVYDYDAIGTDENDADDDSDVDDTGEESSIRIIFCRILPFFDPKY